MASSSDPASSSRNDVLAQEGYLSLNELVGFKNNKPCFRSHCITFNQQSAAALEANIRRGLQPHQVSDIRPWITTSELPPFVRSTIGKLAQAATANPGPRMYYMSREPHTVPDTRVRPAAEWADDDIKFDIEPDVVGDAFTAFRSEQESARQAVKSFHFCPSSSPPPTMPTSHVSSPPFPFLQSSPAPPCEASRQQLQADRDRSRSPRCSPGRKGHFKLDDLVPTIEVDEDDDGGTKIPKPAAPSFDGSMPPPPRLPVSNVEDSSAGYHESQQFEAQESQDQFEAGADGNYEESQGYS